MTLTILVALIVGITAVALAIVIGGFIVFQRWAKKEEQQRPIDTEVAQALRRPKD